MSNFTTPLQFYKLLLHFYNYCYFLMKNADIIQLMRMYTGKAENDFIYLYT